MVYREKEQDIDIVVVERLVGGEAPRPPANRVERAVATFILTQRGKSDSFIADRLGCSERSVLRYRNDNRAQRWAAAIEEVGVLV